SNENCSVVRTWAAIGPAGPPPRTTRSYPSFGCGGRQSGGWAWAICWRFGASKGRIEGVPTFSSLKSTEAGPLVHPRQLFHWSNHFGLSSPCNRSRVEGDKRAKRHRAAKTLPRCIGRCGVDVTEAAEGPRQELEALQQRSARIQKNV